MTTNKPEVKRYTPAYGVDSVMRGHLFMDECDHGAWVSLEDYEALQAECRILESELATVKKVAHGNVDLLDECEKLRKAIRRLCNIYIVDDYYSGDLREELLDRAVERSVDKAIQESNP